MRESSIWSLNLGRYLGVQVRLHVFFLLFGVFTLFLAAQSPQGSLAWYAVLSLTILLLSVLLHEIGHCAATRRVGGSADQIVLSPLGGLASTNVPPEPLAQLAVAAAGPLVNFVILLAAVPLLLLYGADVQGLLNPISPREALEGSLPLVALKLTFWINSVLLILNLLPAPPLDGGRMLRSVLWHAVGYRNAVLSLSMVARLTAVGLCVGAWMLRDTRLPGGTLPGVAIPIWMPLVLIGIFLFFSAKIEADRLAERPLNDDLLGYDFSQGYTSLERSFSPPMPREPGPISRWLKRKRHARDRCQQMAEEEEEWRVDDILARLHELGIDSLSCEDRSILERVSARYRDRQNS